MAPRTSPSASPTPSSQRRKVTTALKKTTSPKAKPATPPASPSPKAAIPSRPPRSSLRASTIVPLSRGSIVSLTPSERSVDNDDPFSYDTGRSKRRSSTIASKAATTRANRSPRSSALRHTTSANSHNSHGSSISFDLNSSTLGLINHAEPPSSSHGHSDSADSGTSSERPVTPPSGPIARDLSTGSIYDPEFVKHARTDSGLPKHVRTDSDLPKLAREDGSNHARTDSDTGRPLLPPKAAYTADKVRRKPVPSGAQPALVDLVSASDDALEHLELELSLDGSRRPNRPRVVSVGSMDALSMYSDVAHRMSVLPGEVVPGSGGAEVAPMYVLAVDPPLRTGTPLAEQQAAAAAAAATAAPRTRQRSDTVTTAPGGGRSRSGTGNMSTRYELARNLPHPDTISMYSTVQARSTPRHSIETATARGISATQTDEVKYSPREEPYTLARRLWLWGWLFPPLWLFGAMIICIPLTVQASPSDMEKAPRLDDMVAIVRQTELKYARRCRNAFIGATILGALVAVAVVLGVMLK